MCNKVLRLAVRRLALALAGAMLFSAGATAGPANYIPVNITFDSRGCPTAAGYAQLSKSAGQKIEWQAVDEQGQAAGWRYEIFFDPFKGRPLSSSGKSGRLRSPPIDGSTPTNVEFKYTVVGSQCPGLPLDPRIKIL